MIINLGQLGRSGNPKPVKKKQKYLFFNKKTDSLINKPLTSKPIYKRTENINEHRVYSPLHITVKMSAFEGRFSSAEGMVLVMKSGTMKLYELSKGRKLWEL